MAVEIHIGDIVTLKKQHPCGSFTWEVTRIGADIGLRCQGCQHRIMLDRKTFEQKLRKIDSETSL